MPNDTQENVLRLLKNFQGTEPLKRLCAELNYTHVAQSLSRRDWSPAANDALADDPLLVAEAGGSEFHVIYARLASDRLTIGFERPAVSQLLRQHPYALFAVSNKTQDRWHFINIKYDKGTNKRRLFRRITIGPEERLRTASERISLLDLSAMGDNLFGLSPLAIQQRHNGMTRLSMSRQ